jgi:N-acetylneuraminate synthase
VPAFKVASFTLSHHPFLKELAEYHKPIIMSTGAHEQAEVQEAVEVLRENGVDDIALLHCVSSYPTPLEEINVRAVETLNREFDHIVGFSDHTVEPAIVPAAAVALGACVVEKHFTLDKKMEGPDHPFALEPDELREMVNRIRRTESALGDGSVSISEIECDTAGRARRSIFATSDLRAGDAITADSIHPLRSGSTSLKGLAPKYLDDIIGNTVIEPIKEGEPIMKYQIELPDN